MVGEIHGPYVVRLQTRQIDSPGDLVVHNFSPLADARRPLEQRVQAVLLAELECLLPSLEGPVPSASVQVYEHLRAVSRAYVRRDPGGLGHFPKLDIHIFLEESRSRRRFFSLRLRLGFGSATKRRQGGHHLLMMCNDWQGEEQRTSEGQGCHPRSLHLIEHPSEKGPKRGADDPRSADVPSHVNGAQGRSVQICLRRSVQQHVGGLAEEAAGEASDEATPVQRVHMSAIGKADETQCPRQAHRVDEPVALGQRHATQ
eukprot:scaffold1616_cov310-Pinguiococcus_pyrenoidosus.AAC.5